MACDNTGTALMMGGLFGIMGTLVAGMMVSMVGGASWLSWEKRQERKYNRRLHRRADIYLRAGLAPYAAKQKAESELQAEAREVLKDLP